MRAKHAGTVTVTFQQDELEDLTDWLRAMMREDPAPVTRKTIMPRVAQALLHELQHRVLTGTLNCTTVINYQEVGRADEP